MLFFLFIGRIEMRYEQVSIDDVFNVEYMLSSNNLVYVGF